MVSSEEKLDAIMDTCLNSTFHATKVCMRRAARGSDGGIGTVLAVRGVKGEKKCDFSWCSGVKCSFDDVHRDSDCRESVEGCY